MLQIQRIISTLHEFDDSENRAGTGFNENTKYFFHMADYKAPMQDSTLNTEKMI